MEKTNVHNQGYNLSLSVNHIFILGVKLHISHVYYRNETQIL